MRITKSVGATTPGNFIRATALRSWRSYKRPSCSLPLQRRLMPLKVDNLILKASLTSLNEHFHNKFVNAVVQLESSRDAWLGRHQMTCRYEEASGLMYAVTIRIARHKCSEDYPSGIISLCFD